MRSIGDPIKKESFTNIFSNNVVEGAVGSSDEILGLRYKANPTYMEKNNKLLNFYIKSSFNSCAGGKLHNDYVDLEQLKMVIKQNVRLLDFEIFNVENRPVIAVSYHDKHKMFKGTFNSLDFKDVMEKINTWAFSPIFCDTPTDPLFLLFRIKTKKTNIFEPMAKILKNTFSPRNRLMDPQYTFSSEHCNMSDMIPNLPISSRNLKNKVVIICQDIYNNVKGTPLYEFVNLSNHKGMGYIQIMSFSDVKSPTSLTELRNETRNKLTICLPDRHYDNVTPLNENYRICVERGIQFIALHYAENNIKSSKDQLKIAGTFHKNVNSSFRIKEPNLRQKDLIKLPNTKKQDPRLNDPQ